MAIIKLKGTSAHDKHIYYEFDTASEPLGEGGMGKVYRGRQISELTGVSRDVAIKFMFDGLPQSVIDRARREASIRIASENLVEMMDFIETTTEGPNHTVYAHYHVVSELLTGIMLADLLNGVTTTKDGRPITFAQNLYRMYQEDRSAFALIIMKNVAAGIMMLHDKGYIHRDIDPTNIMVTEDGKIKLIDFGIAKKLPNRTTTGDRLSTQDRALTQTGQFIGKPQYAAPELIQGDINYQNETTDIYAMGILFYQLLVGKLPFTGTLPQMQKAHLHTKTPVKNIIGITHQTEFRAIVARATEKEQSKRFQSAAEFRVALDAIGTGQGGRGNKRGLLIAGGILALLAVVTVVIFALTGSRKENVTPDNEISVREMLYNENTAMEGWKLLRNQNDDAESLYLQSRIYFEGYDSDSISVMKENLKDIVTPDNVKAHELLERASQLNPNDARILYELGMDCYYGEERGFTMDLYKSEEYFKQALQCAKEANDLGMQERCNVMLEKLSDD